MSSANSTKTGKVTGAGTPHSAKRTPKQTAADVAAGFSITGLLDASSRTRDKFPVVEIPVTDIADHPDNTAYSMDAASIQSLASSILRDGLSDLPLVRKMDDGSWQMISGHRRRAAYALLSEDDPTFAKLPCRVISGISDAQALALLHSANYFVRQLTVTERAAATRALGLEAKRLHKEDPAFADMRTEDVKAAIITSQTGRKISGKTIQREEQMARAIANDLSENWAAEADAGNLSAETVRILAKMPKADQEALYAKRGSAVFTKQQNTALVAEAREIARGTDARLSRALKEMQAFEKNAATKARPLSAADAELLSSIQRLSARLLDSKVK